MQMEKLLTLFINAKAQRGIQAINSSEISSPHSISNQRTSKAIKTNFYDSFMYDKWDMINTCKYSIDISDLQNNQENSAKEIRYFQ